MKSLIRASILLAAVALIILSGCGDSGSQYSNKPLGKAGKVTVDSQASFNQTQRDVVDTMVKFGDATAVRDYKKLCSDVFSSGAQQLQGGCVAVLAAGGKKFKDYSVSVKSVTVAPSGNSATVKIVTHVDNNKGGTATTMNLIKENGEWRISILGAG